MKILKKILSIFLRVGISIALMVYLFSNVDRKSLFEIIRHSNKPLLFLAFFIFFFNYLFCLLRWNSLLKAIKVRLPLKRVSISFAGGTFFNLFLPSTIGGDLMRSIDLSMHTNKTKEVVASVFLDRISGYIGLVVILFVSLILGWKLILEDKTVFVSVAIIIASLFIIMLVMFNKNLYYRINRLLDSPNAGKIRSLIKNLHAEIHFFRHQKKAAVKSLIFSLLIQATLPLTYYFIALSIGVNINLDYFFVFLPIIGAITMLPISIGGLGLRDATTIYFFAKVGVVKDLAFAMSLLNFFFILVYGITGGLIYVLTLHHRRLQYNKPPGV